MNSLPSKIHLERLKVSPVKTQKGRQKVYLYNTFGKTESLPFIKIHTGKQKVYPLKIHIKRKKVYPQKITINSKIFIL